MTAITIIGCVCTVASVVLAIGRPLMENTKSMAALTEAVKNLTEQFTGFEVNNTAAHKRIHERIDSEEKDIKDHENRITKLEAKS